MRSAVVLVKLPAIWALKSLSDQPLSCRAMVTAALPLGISLTLDQVDATLVVEVLDSLWGRAVTRRVHEPLKSDQTVRT